MEYASPQAPARCAATSCARPRPPASCRASLVIHENRGLNPHIEDMARRLALENFVVFAPDALFPLGGYRRQRGQGARAVRQARPGEDARGHGRGVRLAEGAPGVHGPRRRRRLLLRRRHRQHAGDAAARPRGGACRSTAARRTSPTCRKIKAPLLIQSPEMDERINASWPAYEAALKAASVQYERAPLSRHAARLQQRHDAALRRGRREARLAADAGLLQPPRAGRQGLGLAPEFSVESTWHRSSDLCSPAEEQG